MIQNYTTTDGDLFVPGDLVTCYFPGVFHVVSFFVDDVHIVNDFYEKNTLVVVCQMFDKNGNFSREYKICHAEYLKHYRMPYENKT